MGLCQTHPVGSNLADLVREAAEARPNSPAFLSDERTTTWDGVDRLVHAVAGGLTARRLERGDRVAIVMTNCLEFVTSYFGVLRAGLVAVPVSPAYTATELAEVFKSSGAKLVLCTASAIENVELAAGQDIDVIQVGTDGWRRFTVGSTPPPDYETDPESLAALLFTSGTHGAPRGAMLTHRALLSNLDQIQAIDSGIPMIASDDISLIALPMFHIYALNALLGVVVRTASAAVIVDRFDAVETLRLIRKWGVTNVAGVPPMFIAWSTSDSLAEDFAGVRILNSGAAPLSPAVFQQFATAGINIMEGYGMTEASPVICSAVVSGYPKAGSVGKALPGVDVKLIDEQGDQVRDGDPGEIAVRGSNLFSGYWPDGDEGPDEDGWFPTGDVAVLDQDGDFHLVDRRKDLVLVSGFNVYPREIEIVLTNLDGIAQAAVIGVRHPYTGEAVKAYIVLDPGAEVEVESVNEHCATHLAKFKRPSIIEIVEHLPLSVTGKVRKGELRKRAQLVLDDADYSISATNSSLQE